MEKMIDYDKFRLSLKRLEEQHGHYQEWDASLPEWTHEAVAESTIQRFETCYDCLWKALKRYLIEDLGLANVPNSPKPVFRLAAENDLLAAKIQQWLRYANARTDTSHDYDGKKATDCLTLVPDFIDDATDLYQTLTGETWE